MNCMRGYVASIRQLAIMTIRMQMQASFATVLVIAFPPSSGWEDMNLTRWRVLPATSDITQWLYKAQSGMGNTHSF